MKHALLLLALTTSLNSHAAASCAECAQLNAIVKEYKSQLSLAKPEYPKLEAKAVLVVEKMTAKNKVLTSEQLDAYFEVLRYAVANDPGAVFAEDTIEVIRANRKAIDLKLKKLPAREASPLESALDAYTANFESGPN